MFERRMDWIGHVPVLLSVARTGSATAAARQVGISPATAIRQLEKMEHELGVRLFDRTPSGMLPTAVLEKVLPWAEQVEGAAHGLVREVADVEARAEGVVRLALVPALSSWFVAGWLPALLAKHPDLQLELVPGSETVNLLRREADLAIRLVRPETGDLTVRRLVSVELAVVAAPSLLARLRPRSLADLPWVGWDPSMQEADEARWLAAALSQPRIVVRSTDLNTQIRAAQAGVGALVLGEALAVAAGGLVKVQVPTPPLPQSVLWLVAHRVLRDVPRVDAVWTWLLGEFQARASSGELAL